MIYFCSQFLRREREKEKVLDIINNARAEEKFVIFYCDGELMVILWKMLSEILSQTPFSVCSMILLLAKFSSDKNQIYFDGLVL